MIRNIGTHGDSAEPGPLLSQVIIVKPSEIVLACSLRSN